MYNIYCSINCKSTGCKQLMKNNLFDVTSTFTFFQRKKLSEMSDMLLGHCCKLEPSSVAHFDFEYPLASHARAGGDISFNGYLIMFLPSATPFLEVHIDMFPVNTLNYM